MDFLQRARELGISVKSNEDETRFLLNYGIDTPQEYKTHPYVRMCRALMVSENQVVSRSFSRFFNWGEDGVEEEQRKFDWSDFTTQSKEDGSLCVLYYDSGWKMHTRNSFGDGPVHDSGLVWSDLFFDTLGTQHPSLNEDYSYSFELCSPYNRIVRHYDTPQLYLLSAFKRTQSPQELDADSLDKIAHYLNVKRPDIHNFTCHDEVWDHLNCVAQDDKTFEGFVLRDKNGVRFKFKSKEYFRLHKLFGGQLTKNNIALIFQRCLDNDTDEILSYFPDLRPTVKGIQNFIGDAEKRIGGDYRWYNQETNQKEFALSIAHLPHRHVLFFLRKLGGDLNPTKMRMAFDQFFDYFVEEYRKVGQHAKV